MYVRVCSWQILCDRILVFFQFLANHEAMFQWVSISEIMETGGPKKKFLQEYLFMTFREVEGTDIGSVSPPPGSPVRTALSVRSLKGINSADIPLKWLF